MSVWRHAVGTPADKDVRVFEEPDIGFYVGVGNTQSGRYIQIDVHDHQTSEVHVIDATVAGVATAPDRTSRCRPRICDRTCRAARRRPVHHHDQL